MLDEAFAAIRALDARRVGLRRVGGGEDGAVLVERHRLVGLREDAGKAVSDERIGGSPVERAVRRIDDQDDPLGSERARASEVASQTARILSSDVPTS